MSGDVKEGKLNMHASLIRDKIIEKVIGAKKAASAQDCITYCEIIFLIADKKIKQNAVNAFLHELYPSNFQETNNNWRENLTNEKIVQDVCEVKRKAVEEQWTEININLSNIQLKEEMYKRYEMPLKTRKDLSYRIKQLSDNLKIIENNINMSKSQSKELLLRHEYKQAREEYRYLTNKSRKLKYLSQEKMINSTLSKSQEKLNEMQMRIDEISREEKRLKSIERLKYNRQSVKSNDASPRKEKDRLKKLQEIFVHFSKKQVKDLMLFDQIMRTHKYMSLESYLRFVTRSGIGALLSLDERVNIFKTVSQFHPKVSFLEFMDILKEICNKQCEKLNVRFKTTVLDSFLEEMINHLQSSQQKLPASPLFNQSNDFMKNLRSQVFSNYHFKLKGHTGKHTEDIQQFLKQKKKSAKTQPSINISSKLSSVTLIKLTDSQRISKNSDRTFNLDKKFAKGKYTNNYKTVNINHESTSMTKSFQSSLQKQSYSNIFLKKRNILKIGKEEENISSKETPQRNPVDNQSISTHYFGNLTPLNYQEERSNFVSQQLRDIVQLDEDDPFLTNHFAHKYSADTSKAPSQNSKYHF